MSLLRMACAALALGLAATAAPAARDRGGKPASAPAADRARDADRYRGRADVATFAAEVAERQGWDTAWVMLQLHGARRLPRVQQLVMPPPVGQPKNWQAYRDRFVEPRRISAGLAFWQANEAALQRAERDYGVPPEIVVGVIGVETYFGRITGDFRVLDALATLAFDFPSGRSDRSPYFRSELEQLLVLARREGVRADTIKGSYAGAIGWAQFMPGSINRYAVDFDGDGHRDLQRSVTDAVGSVAHYLHAHGWQRGMPTHFEVQPPEPGAGLGTLLAPDIVPSFSAAQMAEHGAQLDAAGRAHDGPLALVRVENGAAAPSHVAGTRNFYVITRYNWSSYYALAVIELGQAIKDARSAAGARIGPTS